MKSLQIRLASRPVGEPTAENFETVETELPAPGDGQLLVSTVYLSLDPYMRGRMSDARSYATPVGIGEVITGGTVCRVETSNDPKFAAGDYVLAMCGWQSAAIVNAKECRRLDPADAPISTAVGVLGMPGLTAYVGLLDIGQPKEGETVVVSAASGAVGSVVGQLARIKGARAVGVAGSPEKVGFVTDELGFDACVSHRSPTLKEDLKAVCAKGVDVYFENVGGATLDAALSLMNPFGRIPVCGMISQYNATALEDGPPRARLMRQILTDRLHVQGFIVTDRWNRFNDFIKEVGGYIRSGELTYREDIVDGLENAPATFIGLLKGENFGKQLIRVSEDPTRG
jgi:NADPH-dependent curcumin reductase CurA